MKRGALLQHLRKHGCVLKREGGSHSLWMNAANGAVEAVPRHTEIPNSLTRKIDPEHLVALALQAGGARRRERALQLLEAGRVDRDRLRALLARHAIAADIPDDV